jgi:small subunit ribosomal protein S20
MKKRGEFMPNIKSAKKRVLTSKKKCEQNKLLSPKNAVKSVDKATTKEEATANLSKAIKRLDKAVSKGLIPKNTAARKKSRLTKKVNNME